ncbi:MAG: hypothetical protein M3133_10460 [Actinomycetota bacterium]|nr:hypothetical protein [Actinomycetota bacterium]
MGADRAELKRLDVGLASGQVLSVRVGEEAYAELRRALAEEGGQGWHVLVTEDSDVSVDLSKVDYLRLETETHRVGF